MCNNYLSSNIDSLQRQQVCLNQMQNRNFSTVHSKLNLKNEQRVPNYLFTCLKCNVYPSGTNLKRKGVQTTCGRLHLPFYVEQ